MALTREQINAKKKPRVKEVGPVPVWGDTVYFRAMSWEEITRLREQFAKDGAASDNAMRPHLLAGVLCDADGNLLFKDGEAAELNQHDSAAFRYLVDEAVKFLGLTKESIEDLAKNSERPSAAGGSA